MFWLKQNFILLFPVLDSFELSLLVSLVFCAFSFRITSHPGVFIQILAGFAGTRR